MGPENVLVGDSMATELFITDWDNGEELLAGRSDVKGPESTYIISAPENLTENPQWSKASDVFSLGVTIYYVVNGDFFVNDSDIAVLNSAEWQPEALAAAIRGAFGSQRINDEALVRLVVRMLHHDPAQRPSMKDILEEARLEQRPS